MLTIWSFVPSFLLPVPSCSAAEAAVAAGLAVTAAGGSTEAASTAAAAAAEQATTAAGGSAAEAAAAAGAATTAAGGSAAEAEAAAEAAATAACAQSTHWSCIGNGGTGQTGGGAQQGGSQAGVGEPTQAPVHSTIPNIAGGSSSNFPIVPGSAINNKIQLQVVTTDLANAASLANIKANTVLLIVAESGGMITSWLAIIITIYL